MANPDDERKLSSAEDENPSLLIRVIVAEKEFTLGQLQLQAGTYIEVSPISQKKSEDPAAREALAFPMMKALGEFGCLPKSDTKIALDAEFTLFVDPAQAISFQPIAYNPHSEAMLFHAAPGNEAETQKILIQKLRRR